METSSFPEFVSSWKVPFIGCPLFRRRPVPACQPRSAAFSGSVQNAQNLDGEQRSHGDHGDDAEGVGDRIAARAPEAPRVKARMKVEAMDRKPRPGVEGDGGEHGRAEAGQAEGQRVAGDEEPPDAEAGHDPEHGDAHGAGHADGQGSQHDVLADVPAGNLLHLRVQHPDRRFGAHHHGSEQEAEGDERSVVLHARDHATKLRAGGDEAALDAHKEEHQSHKGIDKAHADFQEAGWVACAAAETGRPRRAAPEVPAPAPPLRPLQARAAETVRAGPGW